MAQVASIFHTNRNNSLPYYPKEPPILPYPGQYHSTPSLLNNPDTESYQDIHSNFTPPDDTIPFEQFQSHNSNKPFFLLEPNTHLSPTYHNLPHSPLSHDQFDDFSNSADSDSGMLHNPIYRSFSFPQTFPRIADSPECLLKPSSDTQTSPTQIQAPHSLYNIR